MFQSILKYLYSLRHQFAKYFVVGFSGVFLDMGTLVIFKEWFGWWPVLAVAVNQLVVMVYNFSLNKFWSFRNREMPHRQIVRYLILAGVNYLFSILVMYIFNHQLGFDYRLVRLLTIVMMVGWNFFLYKYWVYRQDTKQ